MLSSAPALAKLDKFDGPILDDLDYVRKDQAETAVLFELLADDEVCVGDFRFYSGKRASAMASRLV